MLIKSVQDTTPIDAPARKPSGVSSPAPSVFQAKTERQSGFRSRKNLLALQDLTSMRLERHRIDHPECGLKDALADIIKGYPVEMPPDVLLLMTQFAVGEWEKTAARQQVAA